MVGRKINPARADAPGGEGDAELPAPSRAIRDVRRAQGLSLRALSARAGLPYSTLSKLENGKMALTYDKLIKLAQALNVDIKDLLANAEQRTSPVAVGRRSITRAGEALDAESDKHVHHYPAADLLGKMMTPIIIDVQARSVDELGGLVRHSGEEYLYILQRLDGASLRPLCAADAWPRRLRFISTAAWLTVTSAPAANPAPFLRSAPARESSSWRRPRASGCGSRNSGTIAPTSVSLFETSVSVAMAWPWRRPRRHARSELKRRQFVSRSRFESPNYVFEAMPSIVARIAESETRRKGRSSRSLLSR